MAADPSDRRELIALGLVVRRLRERNNLTQRQLAAAANIHWRTLVRLEHGESSVSVDKLFGVAAALDTRLSVIFAEAEPEVDESPG